MRMIKSLDFNYKGGSKMGEEDKLRARLARLFDLPQEVVLNLPFISLVGNLNLQIENHRGIIRYTPQKVKIRVRRGKLIIAGEDLSIDRLGDDKVELTGHIEGVNFEIS